ncbi:MAG: 16S rRNA (guanine(527)-N(7))-methyltransferase RsmG [Endomicrobia bacterium]|nr:16S rRNA (guanine(527)-N(7))-methyltransferase RsmG [Endomicrobiia bacterium]
MEKKELFNKFKDYAAFNIIADFSEKNSELFKKYFDELVEWNQKFNLISFKSETDLIYRHFCDSLYSAKAILESQSENNKDPGLRHSEAARQSVPDQNYSQKKACRPELVSESAAAANSALQLKVADLGTGSGMPGIPVKIAIPEIKLTLVESITKKCAFLENAAKKLGFDIEILNKRAEEIGQNPAYRQKYDIVLSRAVSKFSPNLEISIPLLKVGGRFIVHKTKNSAESKEEGLPSVENALRHLGAKLENIIPYKLPEQELDYCILVFKKYKDTPAQFPRKPGIPEKKPL